MESFFECAFKLEKFLYAAEEGDDLFSIQQKFGVPLSRIIKDNALCGEIEVGQYIFIDRTGGETFLALPDEEFDRDVIEKKNDAPVVYPFQLLYK